MPLLSVNNLRISFLQGDTELDVVSDIHFTVNDAEVFGIAGESGCGKTVTALSILRLLPHNVKLTGSIIFRGEDLITKSEADLRRIRGKDISMVFQEPMTSLNPVFTVGYQIAEVLITHRGLSRKEAMTEAVELLRSVRMPSPELRIKEYPHQMSGGLRQRVMIAMAIACNPSLLIADEPTTALDVTIQAQILDLLNTLVEGKKMAMLLITHDLGIIAEWATRLAVMYAGRIVELADVREIFRGPRHPYTIGLLDSLPRGRGEALRPIPGQVPRPSELPPGCKFAPRCRYAIHECVEREPGLEPVEQAHLSRCIRARLL